MKKSYFTIPELMLWGISSSFIIISFILFDGEGYLTLVSSLLGVTALIFTAKGNPIGQILMILFSLLYGIISFGAAYYGEMITYLGMTAPMSLYALIIWLKNPFKGDHSQVKIAHLSKIDAFLTITLSLAVTALFYFILRALGTANLLPSTLSVTTSFAAVWLTARRSPYYALAYALNDIVLVVLWLLAAAEDASALSVAICFIAFLANDIYSFINWRRMLREQSE